MKNIIKSLIVVVAVAAVAGGATYAYFNDKVEITGITMSSGTADLKISSNLSSGYVDSYDASGFTSYTNLYPGQNLGNLNFYLKNFSTANIGLDTYFKVETINDNGNVVNDTNALCDAIDLKLKRMGGYETGWHSLCWWRDNFAGNGWKMQDSAISPGVVHGWTASLKVNPNAGNEIQGKTLGLKVTFTGEQHH